MDIFKGQKLKSKFDAVDITNGVNPDDTKAKIKYPAGTEVEVAKIQNNTIWLTFPDGETIANNAYEVLQVYEKVNEAKTLVKTTKGVGTPPKGLFPMMPEGSKWEMNYGWSVVVTLEELNKKARICQECYTDLPEPENEGGTVECPQCKTWKVPVDIDSIIAQ